MDNYKGFFYKNNKEQKYYEGGAHFKYKDLYEILLILEGIESEKDNDTNFNIKENNKLEKIDNNLNINKKTIKIISRNFNQLKYANNPNTQNTQIIFNNHNILKNILNNKSNLGNSISRNYPQNIYLDENNKNYNKTNTTIFNNNHKDNNIRDNFIKTFIQKRNILKNGEKINIKNNLINQNIKMISLKNDFNKKFSHKKIFISKKGLYTNNNNLSNVQFKENNNNCNNNVNKLIKIRKNNKSITCDKKKVKGFNYLKENLNIYFPKKSNGINHSKRKNNKNILGLGITFDYNKEQNKDIKYNDKNSSNSNNLKEKANNKIIYNMKNYSSGINMNNYLNNNNMNKTIYKKIIFDGNNLYTKKYINNIVKNNNDFISQKDIRKKTIQLFNLNKNPNIIKSKKNLSRNINNLNYIYNFKSYKFKTSSEINKNNKI